MTLRLHRSHERAATLSGSADIIDRIATLSGLVSRECVDDRLRAIDDPSERTLLDALATAGVAPVVPSCALCDSQKRGRCCAHREASTPPLTPPCEVTYPLEQPRGAANTRGHDRTFALSGARFDGINTTHRRSKTQA